MKIAETYIIKNEPTSGYKMVSGTPLCRHVEEEHLIGRCMCQGLTLGVPDFHNSKAFTVVRAEPNTAALMGLFHVYQNEV